MHRPGSVCVENISAGQTKDFAAILVKPNFFFVSNWCLSQAKAFPVSH